MTMTPQAQELPAAAPLHVVAAPGRIRICHIMSADLWAGAEAQVATVASYLVGRPDVDLTAVLLNEGPLARELRRLRVPVTVIDERRNDAIRIWISLVRLLRKHPVEIVHTHRYKDTVLGAVAARLAGVPCVVRTVHGRSEPMTGWAWAKFRAYEALDGLTLRCLADRIIAVSRRMAEGLEESGYRPGTVVHIHNGVDLDKVRPARGRDDVRRELGIDPVTPLIGTVGRLSPVKGHGRFLQAARLILQKEPRARFLIVGDGPLRSELLGSARRLQIDRACAFLGARTDVYDLLAAMDVFVLPSLDEGIPMALLEAMALGRAVVAAAVGGVPEIVTHRVTGLLVESGDARALAEACLELALDRRWAATLGARARRTVEEEFSHDKNGLAVVNLYRAITGGPAAGEAEGIGRRQARGGLGMPPPPPRPSLHVAPRLDGGHRKTDPARGARPSAWEMVRGLASHGARRLRDSAVGLLERRRMVRIRRDPRELVAALGSARRILIVCRGNIIRSPFTARLLARARGDDERVSIASGGLAAAPGTPPPRTAIAVAAALHVDLSRHVASTVTPESVAGSDVVLVMDVPQLVVMRRRFPQARGKTFLLTCLAPQCPLEVRDPVDRDEAAFQACFEHIVESVPPIVRLLARSARGQ